MKSSFTVAGSEYVTGMYGKYHRPLRLAKENCTPDHSQSAYICELTAQGPRPHFPLHGNEIRRGEKHMRADNCVYCAQRIISLHVGTTLEDRAFDSWRTVSSVRPATVIEEEPV